MAATTAGEEGASVLPDLDGLDDIIARLLELHGFAPRYREPEVSGELSRPCSCDRPWEFESGHCYCCGHDVRLEVIGDEIRPYWADDRAAHPDDGRQEVDDDDLARCIYCGEESRWNFAVDPCPSCGYVPD